jgi:type II secretory pathway pseudopilin PulG
MVIMVILMTQAPKIGNALYDSRAQENTWLIQRATSQARLRVEDRVMTTKRREARGNPHRTATNLLLKLFQNEASLGIIITGGTVLWLLIR